MTNWTKLNSKLVTVLYIPSIFYPMKQLKSVHDFAPTLNNIIRVHV